MKLKLAFAVFLLLTSFATVSANADESKTYNVDIVFGSANVENGRFYNPSIVIINIGDSISWMNLDKDPHTVTDGTPQSQWGKVFDSGVMRQGKEFRFKFTRAGEYPYLCALHPWMTGKVIVQDPVANSVQSSDITVTPKLNVFIKSEKQSYVQDEIVRFTIEVIGTGNRPTDPDKIEAQFGIEELKPVTLSRIDVGKYMYSTTELKPGSYNLTIKASKEKFEAGSSLLTIHVVKGISKEDKVVEPEINIKADQKKYYPGDMVTVGGSVSRMVENKSLVLQVFDGTNRLHVRAQTSIDADGTFEWKFKVPDKSSGIWTVRTKYFDEMVSVSFEIVNTSEVESPSPKTDTRQARPLISAPVMKFKEEKVSILHSSITDQLNTQLYSVSKGQSVMIQSLIRNNHEVQQPFAYLTQIKDSNGIVVKLEAVEGVLPTGKSFTVAISWTPESSGDHTIEVFVWKGLQEPIPLSLNLLSSKVDVTR
ncbi:MAG: plastocyanin/azurin family copper-binding protein [Nitrososphaerales archaeon]